MKYFAFRKQDLWILYILLPPYLITVDYLLLDDRYFQFPVIIWATLISIIIGILSWMTHIIAANILRDYIPDYLQTVKRILIQLPVYIILTSILGLSIFYAFSYFDFVSYPLSFSSFKSTFIAGIILNIAATSFHEGMYAFDKWKVSTLEAEHLKKNYLQSQFESLKNQVNPHFLFNSLNCLSALISSDQEKAIEFLDEMSKVYRYLLRSNEHELISLAAELQFINSYFHMLKTRYADAIELSIKVSAKHKNYVLPPLTLQMLIENAVKHNVIFKDKPLVINITINELDYLTVSNNIQKKTSKILSNKVGLQNIITKYQLLNHSAIIIKNDDDVFAVSLPLIKNLNNESTDHRR